MTVLRTLMILLAPLPTQSLALSIWVPQTFGEYIDNLNALGQPYKIAYGHFASIEPLTVADTTAEQPANFVASGYRSKTISAAAVFALVDPRRTPRLHGQLAVQLTRYWDNAPDMEGYRPAPDGYKYINFIDLGDPANGDRIHTFMVNPDGSLTETGDNYMFSGPFTGAQARELKRCVFEGACGENDLRRLRHIPYGRD